MSSQLLEEDVQKKFLRLRYNIENLCRKYERISKEEAANLELNCSTGEWVQVVKPGKKPLSEGEVKAKLRELDFSKDLVCSSANVGSITDEKIKVRVMKHNKRFERYYKKTKAQDEDSESDDDENDDPLSQFDDEYRTVPKLPHIDFDNSEEEEILRAGNTSSKDLEDGKEENYDENEDEQEIVIPVGNSFKKNPKFEPYSVPVRRSPRVKKPVKYF